MEKAALKNIIDRNVPFTIVTASGQTYDIPHTDYILVSPGEYNTVIAYTADGDGTNMLDLRTITDLQIASENAG